MTMKKINYLFLFFILLAGCQKFEIIQDPEFDVYVNRDTYYLGDTVMFHFRGDVDVISMYSGEMGNDYDFVSGREMRSNFHISFDTQTLDGAQEDQIAILFSTDFNRDYTIDGVNASNWTDISDRFRLAKPSDNRAWIASGKGNIDDLLGEDEITFHLAVRHTVRDQTIYGTGNLNRVRGLRITGANEVGETTVFSHIQDNWTLFSTPNKMPGRASIEASQMTLRQSFGNNYVREHTEDWVVSIPITIVPILNMGPDLGLGIKSLADQMPKTYGYIFNQPGHYKVVFKGINQNIDNRKEIVKEINITIL